MREDSKIIVSRTTDQDGALMARAVLLEPVDGINDPRDEPCFGAVHIIEIRGPDAHTMVRDSAWDVMKDEFWDENHFNLIWQRAEEVA